MSNDLHPRTDRTLRVLHDPPLTGPDNMGRDDLLLERVAAGLSPPTLRFYAWEPPTISLGYFQRFADYEALPPPVGDLPVVRRPTGGGAILHDQELTYSLALPTGHALLDAGPACLYESVHSALITALGGPASPAKRCGTTDDSGPAKGPFFCFARRHRVDVVVGDQKLAGSAQRRTKNAILQHGSIILDSRFPQQPTATTSALGDWTASDLAARIAQTFAAANQLETEVGNWTSEELQAAEPHIAKHASSAWLKRR